MHLWLFRFADPTHPLQSLRCGASDRVQACVLVEEFLKAIGRPVHFMPLQPRPADNVLVSQMGRVDLDSPRVISCIDRAGEIISNEVTR